MHKKAISILSFLFCIALSYRLVGQESAPGPIVVCPGHDFDVHTRLVPDKPPINAKLTQTATFIVEYIGFTNEAREAFQYAVDIWQTKITSTIPIRIRATWTELDEGVLGSAGAFSVYRDFDGAPERNVWYPVALAEKLARKELNATNEPDIIANFNSGANWYLGTDGNVPSRSTDFVTVVLHEIAHGLGFVSTMNVDDNVGRWGHPTLPIVFDPFIENNNRQKLTNTSLFANPSTALRNQLISNNLFFRGPVIDQKDGVRPKLFAPSPFDLGSSISHLDENSYPPLNTNSLMTPRIATAEAIHDPGPLVLEMFAEIGWESTYIDVSQNKDIENTSAPITLRAIIHTDNSILPETLILSYSTNNFVTRTQVQMNATPNPHEFIVTIPATMAPGVVSYYIQVRDNYNRRFSSPFNAPDNYHQIRIGPDFTLPIVQHEPIEFVVVSDLSLSIEAVVQDNLGIRDVTVEYSVNNTPQTSFQLAHAGNDIYSGNFVFPAGMLKPDDQIRYRIIARDISRNVNRTIVPAQGFFTINVRDEIIPQSSYINDFSTPTSDFAGNGFRITTPSNFNNPAIHSDHPYSDGFGSGNQSTYIYQLLIPIIVEHQEAIMRWNEIVLVEPGETGSRFGDPEFFDYVIVEGSKDNGLTWKPLKPGYDSRKHPVWLQHYNSNMLEGNSQAEGNPNLFRPDSVNLLNSFSGGDIILIRFRLHADEAAYGWGWAIDDLNIQGTPRELKERLVLKPNPTAGPAFLEIPLQETTRYAEIRIFDMQGQQIYFERYLDPLSRFIKEINLDSFSPGVYIVHFKTDHVQMSKRLILIR